MSLSRRDFSCSLAMRDPLDAALRRTTDGALRLMPARTPA